MTFLSSFTALTISGFSSVPELSLSIIIKHCRAACVGYASTYAKASDAGSRAFRNSLVNLAISFAAALAWASRALARCASLFRSAVSIASSLRGTSTGEPRRRSRSRSDGVRLHHQHTSTAARHQRRKPSSRRSKAPPSFGLRNAPLVAVDLAVAVRVQLREGRLEARGDQQVLEVLIAAVREEVDHFFIRSDRCDAARESGGERRVASMAYELDRLCGPHVIAATP